MLIQGCTLKKGDAGEQECSRYGSLSEATLAVTIHWTGILDWTTGLKFFPFLDKYLCFKLWLSLFTGLDYWTGILDWTTGLEFFPFLDKLSIWFLTSGGDLSSF